MLGLSYADIRVIYLCITRAEEDPGTCRIMMAAGACFKERHARGEPPLPLDTGGILGVAPFGCPTTLSSGAVV